MSFHTEMLHSGHRKEAFSCGSEMIDQYLHRQASQDIKRKLSACYVLPEAETGLVKGYYTLSNNSIQLADVPVDFQKNLPRSYTSLPTTLLGRLAVDSRFQGTGLGGLLLIDALKRSDEASFTMGSFAVIVDPLDATSEHYYKKYGFIKLEDSGKMFLAMKTIHVLFQ